MAGGQHDGRFRFGGFELEVRSRELRDGTRRQRLQEQPFEILRALLARPGEVVTRDELRQRLWPDGTFVDFEHSLNAAVKRLRAVLGDDADNPRFVETLPRRGYRFIAGVSTDDSSSTRSTATRLGPSQPQVRLAVLPFANLGHDPAEQYFSDGLTEEMIAQLGRLCRERIGIIARTSSIVAHHEHQTADAIGEALRADYLLEGGVRSHGDRVRITARLIDTRSATHLWSDTYERRITDYLSVQVDVAARIAQSLATGLLETDRPGSDTQATHTEAYQAYLKGRYHWNMPGDDGLTEALRDFERALELDPQFAAAHASKARALVVRAEYYAERPRNLLVLAAASARRALELDPDHWRAYVALGDVRRALDWDWDGADAAYLRASDLNPSSESAHRARGVLMASRGRFAEAADALERAVELDPLCLAVGTSAAWVHYVAGDYRAAEQRCLQYADLDRRYGFSAAHRLLGAVYLQMGRVGDAIEVLRQALADNVDEPVLVAWLANAFGVAGDRSSAVAMLSRMAPESGRRIAGYHLALAAVGAGAHDLAFDALERALADREPTLMHLGVEPRWASLHGDARFDRLLATLRLTIPRTTRMTRGTS